MPRRACLLLLGASLASVGSGGCTALAGLDELAFGAGGGGASPTAAASSTTQSGGGTTATGGSAGSSSYASVVLEDGPLAYWRFGDAAGATMAVDETGNHDAAYVGTVALGEPGAISDDPDTAARFDGRSKVIVGDVFDFVGGQPFSLEAWVKQDDSPLSYQGICTKLDSPLGEGYVLYMTNPHHPKFTVWSSDTPGDAALGAPLPVGTYTHLVATFDGTKARLFVNGIESASHDAVGPTVDVTVPFEIAMNHEGNELIGALDEVAVYATALSPDRIGAHYQAGTR